MAQRMSGGDWLVATLDALGAQLKGNAWAARIVAFVIDYLLCGFISIIPGLVTYNLLIGGDGTFTSLANFVDAGKGLGITACVLALSLFLTFAYYVLVPLRLMPGQTPGKRLIHLEVVMLDGSAATLKALSLRWAVMTFVETLFTMGASYVMQFLEVLAPGSLSTTYSFVGMAISAASALYAWRNSEHRAFHDVVADTWVYHDRG